jgi:membrane protein implicated in regulation of membrane protease activity
MSPAILYTVGRFACFAIVAAILYAVGARSWLLVIASLVVSAPISYVLLKPVRNRWSIQIDQRLARRKAEKEKLRATLRGDDEDET